MPDAGCGNSELSPIFFAAALRVPPEALESAREHSESFQTTSKSPEGTPSASPRPFFQQETTRVLRRRQKRGLGACRVRLRDLNLVTEALRMPLDELKVVGKHSKCFRTTSKSLGGTRSAGVQPRSISSSRPGYHRRVKESTGMEMAYRERWKAEIAATRRVLVRLACPARCGAGRSGRPTGALSLRFAALSSREIVASSRALGVGRRSRRVAAFFRDCAPALAAGRR